MFHHRLPALAGLFMIQASIATAELQQVPTFSIDGLTCKDSLSTLMFRGEHAYFIDTQHGNVPDGVDTYTLKGLRLLLKTSYGVEIPGDFSADYSNLLLHVGGPIGARFLTCQRSGNSITLTTTAPVTVPYGISRTLPILLPPLGFVGSTLTPRLLGSYCAAGITQVWYTSSPNQNYWQQMTLEPNGSWHYDAYRPYYLLFELSQVMHNIGQCTVTFTISNFGLN